MNSWVIRCNGFIAGRYWGDKEQDALDNLAKDHGALGIVARKLNKEGKPIVYESFEKLCLDTGFTRDNFKMEKVV